MLDIEVIVDDEMKYNFKENGKDISGALF